MRPTKFISFCLVVLLLIPSLSFAAFTDLNDHWAKDAILSLEAKDFFSEEDTFKPQQTISHAEVFDLLQQAFSLSPEEQEQLQAWLTDLLVSHSEGVTRGEFAALLGNILGLGEYSSRPKSFYTSFSDLELDYPGFLGVELLQRYNLLPSHMQGRFEPYRLINKAEVAFILNEALSLHKIEATVVSVEADESLVLELANQEQLELEILASTLFLDASGFKDLQLTKGTTVQAISRNGQALLINHQTGEQTVALMQGINKAASALAEILTPEQINALIAGDWDELGEEVRYQVYEELVERGITPWEADALIKQDWDNLQVMVQDRLTQEAAAYLDVAPELIQAALGLDWSKLLEYAQVEVAQRLLTSDWLQDTLGQK